MTLYFAINSDFERIINSSHKIISCYSRSYNPENFLRANKIIKTYFVCIYLRIPGIILDKALSATVRYNCWLAYGSKKFQLGLSFFKEHFIQ